MRAFSAVPVAIVVCVAAPAFADAQTHVKAAKKAERRREWRKALQEWKAAYKAEANAEYLIGIGDAYAKLGNGAEAKKSYEAYLADPLALPANAQKVREKLARLEAPPAGALALPGPGLTLPGAAATPPPRKVEPTLPLPGLDAPGPAPAKTARAEPPPLTLPGVAPAKKDDRAVAALPPLPLPGSAAPAKKEPAPAVAASEAAKAPPKPIAMVTPERPVERAPVEALAVAPFPRESRSSSGVQRTMAYVTAGVAIAALGGGVLAYTKASSAHDDLTSKIHTGTEAQRLLENERSNRTLSFVGLAGGLVAAGISAALFAF